MKKIFSLVVLMLTVFTMSVSAQSVSYPKFHLGIRAGLSVNSNTADGTKSLAFPQGGINFDFRVAPFPLYIETGVDYMNKGCKLEYTDYDGSKYSDNYDDHYIHVPLLASYHIYLNDKMSVQPFVGYTMGYLTETEEYDSAIRLGCGFNFGRLYANVGYDIGVTNHGDDEYNDGYKNNTFFVTVGFNFIGGGR